MKTLPLISLFLLCSCNFMSNGQSAQKVDVKTFQTNLNKSENALLLDVRTPQEFEERHLANALNIDINGDDFEGKVGKLDKEKTIFVYCLSGGRSTTAAAALAKKGFKNVYNLEGGILAWVNAGNPIETSVASAEVAGLNTESYLKLVTKEKLVLVDFNAVWCGPCKKLKPIVEKIEKKHSDKMEVLAIDVDKENVLANQMNITGIPLLILYKSGKEVWRNMGLIGEKELEAVIVAN